MQEIKLGTVITELVAKNSTRFAIWKILKLDQMW